MGVHNLLVLMRCHNTPRVFVKPRKSILQDVTHLAQSLSNCSHPIDYDVSYIIAWPLLHLSHCLSMSRYQTRTCHYMSMTIYFENKSHVLFVLLTQNIYEHINMKIEPYTYYQDKLDWLSLTPIMFKQSQNYLVWFPILISCSSIEFLQVQKGHKTCFS